MNTPDYIATLEVAAQRIATKALRVSSIDTVTIIYDRSQSTIALALEMAIRNQHGGVNHYLIDDRVKRPVTEVPASLLYELKRSQMTVFIGGRWDDETPFRRDLLDNIMILGLRHAHICGVSQLGLIEGVAADCSVVGALNDYMKQRIKKAKIIRVRSDLGTDVEVKISPRERYFLLSGEIQSERWENLPSGEIVTTPTRVDGVFVCDGIPPGGFAVSRDQMRENPLRMELHRGKLISIGGGSGDLASKVEALLRAGENTDRIGGVFVGTNYAIKDPTSGELGPEVVKPGVSFAFGQFPTARPVMVKWQSDQDYPFTARRTSLDLDGELVIENGKYQTYIVEAVGAL